MSAVKMDCKPPIDIKLENFSGVKYRGVTESHDTTKSHVNDHAYHAGSLSLNDRNTKGIGNSPSIIKVTAEPERPCSPLSSASEMLAMLQSLPMKLKKIQSNCNIPSLDPVKCDAPVKRTRSVFTSDSCRAQESLYHPTLKKHRHESKTDCEHPRLSKKPAPQIPESTFQPPQSSSIAFLRVSLFPPQLMKTCSNFQPEQPAQNGIANQMDFRAHNSDADQKRLISAMENLKSENSKLKEENAELEQKLQECRSKLMQFDNKVCTLLRREKELYDELQEQKQRLCWSGISQSDVDIKFYTGLPDAAAFNWILDLCTAKPIEYHKWRVSNMSFADQLLAILMILKLNVSQKMLADWFDVSRGTIFNLEKTWISLLHKELFKEFCENPLTKRRNEFPQYFPVDLESQCVYGFVEIEKAVVQIQCQEKQVGTLKGILGVTSGGRIVSASKLYEDIVEKDIISNSGLLDVLNPGDYILDPEDYLAEDNEAVTHYHHPPSFQLFKKGLERVDKAFHRVKEYAVVDRIPLSLAPVATEVWQVCAALTCLRKFACPNAK